MQSVLVTRTDNDGDVLLAGPAIRAVAATADVVLLVAPSGEQAARMLPGVQDVMVWPCPWSGFDPPRVDPVRTAALVDALRAERFSRALVLTSFHQSPLPMALLLRLAGIPDIAAQCEDYPGSLLDLRHRPGPGGHEVERALSLAAAAGFELPAGDDGRLAVSPPPRTDSLPEAPFVVVHPGASVPARAPGAEQAAAIIAALRDDGWTVLVTGSAAERELTRAVAVAGAEDRGGRTSYRELAALLAAARCVVVGNTGPAHLAAAVGTPVVSLFAPVVPAERWAPWGVPSVVLGDQYAACRGSRARQCPVAGHPCLGGVTPDEVVNAVTKLTQEVAR
jgi:ADP-heptose:LPS heptosyltransferase